MAPNVTQVASTFPPSSIKTWFWGPHREYRKLKKRRAAGEPEEDQDEEDVEQGESVMS